MSYNNQYLVSATCYHALAQSPDEEMKKIVLKVVKQCVGTDGVDAAYVREEILPEYFRAFWVRRMALDRRNHKQVTYVIIVILCHTGMVQYDIVCLND